MMDDGRVAVHHLRRQAVYARVTFVQINPEDLEGAVRDFDESVIPAARQEAGFQGALLLVRDDGTAMAVDLSDTLEHMQANERSGFYQSQVAKFRDRIVGHPRREVYRVAVARGVRGGVELLEEAS